MLRVIDDPSLVGTLYYSEGETQQPVVAIWGGSGGDDFSDRAVVKQSVEMLVENGYAVLALTYFDFDRQSGAIPNALYRVPLEYFGHAFRWVQKQPDLKKNTIAVYGVSLGGELALLLASKFEIIDLVVAGVPSAYAWGSNDRNRTEKDWIELMETDPCQAAWAGKDIPHICNQLLVSYEPWYSVIENSKLVEGAFIPVERSSAAILLTSASHDYVWPSKEMSERIMSRLEEKEYSFPFKHLSYRSTHDVHSRSWPDIFDFISLHYPVN
ncbi:acyl-CoA thioester hydrolase/BAAT C-terminal domain-containing protein [Vibrio sp. 99-70-13A1]|uniref:alpha/beta hydrolase n=1 Tax=Vibrio sp. 99-70-13A1 TaxID=2607601 RepID=UPI00149346F9|nr:acyl-CoA thioester hydrolase/BAAT C-terminal domain-containing protein [Vibrio sp. 99-70-13A1]NOH99277.1 hypothetical protein [Vibrio sp. 99-70-13A1]